MIVHIFLLCLLLATDRKALSDVETHVLLTARTRVELPAKIEDMVPRALPSIYRRRQEIASAVASLPVPSNDSLFALSVLAGLLKGSPKLKCIVLRSLMLQGSGQEFQEFQRTLGEDYLLLSEFDNMGCRMDRAG